MALLGTVVMGEVKTPVSGIRSGIAVPEKGIVEFVELGSRQTDYGLRHPDVGTKEVIAFWGDLEPAEGHFDWGKLDGLFDAWESAGKKIRIRLATAHDGPDFTPDWVLHRYHIRSIAKGTWIDFETQMPEGMAFAGDSAITEMGTEVLSGSKSLRFRSTGRESVALRFRPQGGFQKGTTYLFDFDYRIRKDDARGYARFLTGEGKEVARESFELKGGLGESCCLRLKSKDVRAETLELVFEGDASGSLDNVLITSLVRNPPWRILKPEDAEPEWELSGGAEWITDERGRRAVRLAEKGAAVSTSPRVAPFIIGESYQAYYGYKRLKESTVTHRLTDGSGDHAQQTFKVNKSEGERGVWFDRKVWKPGQKIEIRMDSDGEMLLYNVGWRCNSAQITVLPDYFSPKFVQKWSQFVSAFALRYGNRTGLGTVSVGGIGRWEEVMLDGGPALEPQWRARGYSHESYMKRIDEAMGFYRKTFPSHPLQIQLAHGLSRDGLESKLTYWNVGRLAFQNGVGLKQNGLSEKYYTFGAEPAARNVPTVMYHEFHGTPGMGFTYETGAQIYNNGLGVHGHPISLLNRALIDGVDSLLLYENDVSQPTINQFFMPFVAQAGRPAATTLFNQIGKFPLRHPRFGNQEYQNLWLGIRHHAGPGATPELTVKAGRPCLVTRPENPRIAWDINAEVMHDGMYGVTLSLEYLDEGNDGFSVQAFNKRSQIWETLVRIQKNGTGAWKTVSFMSRNLCDEPRSGLNEMMDVAVDDDGDGMEAISRIEVQHVSVRGWENQIMTEMGPGSRSGLIPDQEMGPNESAGVFRRFTVSPTQAVSTVSVQFSEIDRNSDKVGARIRVYSEGDSEMVGESWVLNPSPGKWYSVPVVPRAGRSQFKIQIDRRTGGVMAALGNDGELAFRAATYLADPSATSLKIEGGKGNFTSPKPFYGFKLKASAALNPGFIRVFKVLEGDGDGSVAIAWDVAGIDRSGFTHVLGEPQTGGRYRIEINTKEPVELLPLVLKPAFQPRPTSTSDLGRPVMMVDRPEYPKSGGIEWNLPQAVVAEAKQAIRFELFNSTSTSLACLEWWREGESAPESTYISIVPWDTGLRSQTVNVGLFPQWKGVISRIRLTPAISQFDGGSFKGGAASMHEVDFRAD